MVDDAGAEEKAGLRGALAAVEGNGRASQSWVPTADVWETENEVVYAFDLPGIPEDKISVELDDNTLTVSAERERSEKVGS